MNNEQIINYLKQNKDRYSKDQLRQSLLNTGWGESDINKAFEIVYKDLEKKNGDTEPSKSPTKHQTSKKLNLSIFLTIVFWFILLFILPGFVIWFQNTNPFALKKAEENKEQQIVQTAKIIIHEEGEDEERELSNDSEYFSEIQNKTEDLITFSDSFTKLGEPESKDEGLKYLKSRFYIKIEYSSPKIFQELTANGMKKNIEVKAIIKPLDYLHTVYIHQPDGLIQQYRAGYRYGKFDEAQINQQEIRDLILKEKSTHEPPLIEIPKDLKEDVIIFYSGGKGELITAPHKLKNEIESHMQYLSDYNYSTQEPMVENLRRNQDKDSYLLELVYKNPKTISIETGEVSLKRIIFVLEGDFKIDFKDINNNMRSDYSIGCDPDGYLDHYCGYSFVAYNEQNRILLLGPNWSKNTQQDTDTKRELLNDLFVSKIKNLAMQEINKLNWEK